jgi:hypothetical protein
MAALSLWPSMVELPPQVGAPRRRHGEHRRHGGRDLGRRVAVQRGRQVGAEPGRLAQSPQGQEFTDRGFRQGAQEDERQDGEDAAADTVALPRIDQPGAQPVDAEAGDRDRQQAEHAAPARRRHAGGRCRVD